MTFTGIVKIILVFLTFTQPLKHRRASIFLQEIELNRVQFIPFMTLEHEIAPFLVNLVTGLIDIVVTSRSQSYHMLHYTAASTNHSVSRRLWLWTNFLVCSFDVDKLLCFLHATNQSLYHVRIFCPRHFTRNCFSPGRW